MQSVRQFLKPTKEKIILVIILFFLTIFISVLQGRARVELHRGIAVAEMKVKILENIKTFFLFPFYLIGKYMIIPRTPPSFDIIYLPSLPEILMLFISTILYWYLLSCLITWIYDNFKKKSQSNRF